MMQRIRHTPAQHPVFVQPRFVFFHRRSSPTQLRFEISVGFRRIHRWKILVLHATQDVLLYYYQLNIFFVFLIEIHKNKDTHYLSVSPIESCSFVSRKGQTKTRPSYCTSPRELCGVQTLRWHWRRIHPAIRTCFLQILLRSPSHLKTKLYVQHACNKGLIYAINLLENYEPNAD